MVCITKWAFDVCWPLLSCSKASCWVLPSCLKAVAKLLKERHGIDVARIQTDFKGDTVQPFTNNDMNRVTIGVAEVE